MSEPWKGGNRHLTLRLGVVLLLIISLVTLTVGVFATRPHAWALASALLLFDAGVLWWLYRSILRPIDRELAKRDRIELQLIRRAEEIEDLYNRSPCGYLSLRPEGQVVRVNDTAVGWLKRPRKEVLTRPVFELLTSTSQEVLREGLARLQHGSSFRELEVEFIRGDGKLMNALLSSSVLRDEAAEELLIRVAFVDISERKRSEDCLVEISASLNLAYERLSMTMTAARIGNWDWNLRKNEMNWSENFYEVVGVVRGQVEQSLEGFLEIVAPEDRERLATYVQVSLADPTVLQLEPIEYRVRPPSGRERWIESKGRVFREELGAAIGMMGTVMDVTQRRSADEQLRTARDAADSANKAKSSFLANMSHEIRTPLNGIIGMIELLMQSPVNQQQKEYLDSLSQSADSLLALINDILDISKIEAGKLDLEQIPFDVRELAHGAVRVVAAGAERKGLALACRLDDRLPQTVLGDPGRLRQVLLNLLSNAVKFTAQGDVALTVDYVADRKCVRFSVRDTGPGIEPERQEAIFDPFAQAELSTARTHGGTGLGLSISARLVDSMGGRLTVASTPGEGSMFSFLIPLPVVDRRSVLPSPMPPEAIADEGRPQALLLLVEDNPINQQVMTLLLSKAGYTVEVVGNGREALEAVERRRYDLVLMDVQMPEMDGLRATRLIRQREKVTGGHVPIVAVTANALQGERQRCLAAGMDDYLAKPVRGAELFPTVARLLGGKPRAELSPVGQPVSAATTETGPAWKTALMGMGFGTEAITKLVRTFLDTVPPRLASLRQGVAAGEAAQVHQTAHSLKGSLAVFMASKALCIAEQLEHLGRDRRLQAAEPLLRDLAVELEPFIVSMRAYLEKSS